LQYTDDEAEVESLQRRHGVEVLRVPHLTRHEDYGETFSLVAALDLVVTVPTSVLHVAGSVGRECFVVMDRRAAWRECSADVRLPWYPLTHERFVREPTSESWTGVMQAVTSAFNRWSPAARATHPT
jgi:ADP-heptose:LPS heptosyltransferase